jgi:trehalose-6-phosphatase
MNDSKLVNKKTLFFVNNKNKFHIVADFDGTLTQYFDDN